MAESKVGKDGKRVQLGREFDIKEASKKLDALIKKQVEDKNKKDE